MTTIQEALGKAGLGAPPDHDQPPADAPAPVAPGPDVNLAEVARFLGPEAAFMERTGARRVAEHRAR
jgi:hypothetical protein